MRKQTHFLCGGVIAAAMLALAACTPQVTTTIPSVLQIQNVEQEEKSVVIHSRETVEVVPDRAEIVYGITTEDADASKCQQKNAEKLEEVLSYLKDQGYTDKSIKTTGFSLNPRYDWSGSSRRLIGYEMSTEITVTDVALENVGGLLSDTVESGANEIQSVTYFSSSYDEAYQEALSRAVELAQAKAETLAHAGGYQVVGIRTIEEQQDNQYGRYVNSGISGNVQLGAAKEEVLDMEVMPGEMQITAEIRVEFEILPR